MSQLRHPATDETRITHTPGPWSAQWIGGNYAVRDEEGHGVAFTNSAARSSAAVRSKVDGDEEPQANARLIAAAPELLEALEPFAKFACDEPNDCHNCRALAAIKKARGQ